MTWLYLPQAQTYVNDAHVGVVQLVPSAETGAIVEIRVHGPIEQLPGQYLRVTDQEDIVAALRWLRSARAEAGEETTT